MKYYHWLLIVTIVMAAMESCRSTKKIQTAITPKPPRDTIHVVTHVDTKADSLRYIQQVISGIDKNHIDFHTFKAKVKVNFEDKDGKNTDFNCFISLYKDSILWVSINALLGIEAMRAVITKDSVKVVDKLKKTVRLRSVSYLQEVAHIPLTFKELQDILIGNPVYLDSNNIVSYRKDEKTISLISLGDFFRNLLTVGTSDYNLQHSKLDDIDDTRARTADITYGDYVNKDGFHFSTYRRITVSEKSKLDIELQFKQIDFNASLSFPLVIPKNYKRL